MKLMILDGNSIVNRAYYGIRPLSAPDGTPTNAIYGFIAILQRMLDEHTPEAVAVTFDLKAPTFRHKAYEGYKAQRKSMPEDLAVQLPILKSVLDDMGIRRYELEGYEADDLLGTAAAVCEKSGWNCVIVTGDKDSLQLISEKTTVCNVKSKMGRTETVNYTPEHFFEEYGFKPERMVDLKALMGDSSDNIPGVPGIGEKGAMELLHRFGSLEEIYSKLDTIDIKPGVRKKLTEGEESAKKSYWLATIVRDAPFDFKPEENIWHEDYRPELYDSFKRLGFNKFIEKWGLSAPEQKREKADTGAVEHRQIDASGLEDLMAAVKSAESLAVYAEKGLDSIELCFEGSCCSVSWNGCGEGYNELLRAVFTEGTKLIAHNVKDLMTLLIAEGLPYECFGFDTALAAYLLDATENEYSLERLSMRYTGSEKHGAEAVYAISGSLKAALDSFGMSKLYYSAELPLCAVLAEMETAGFLVDRKALYDFGESLNSDIAALQQRVWSYAGHEFNINSPKQLGEVLFDELYLPAGKKNKSGWSTNADVLEKLRGKHPIVGDVLEYRMLTKLKSTYADGLLKVISPDGRIHTKFQMTVTATGRLSSTEPNLQNIPIRKELGAEIRKMFVAAPGMCLVDADYSQIELRLLAHIADDKTMQEAFLSGEDFHTVTAAHVFNLPVEEVTPTLRSRAKAVNFGIVYGISAFSLSQDIGVFPKEAQAYMDAYMEKYHGVRDYMKAVVEKAKADGYVTTVYGRRRELPELKSSNFNMRQFGERVALNMPVQGTAADIMKLAMVNVRRRFKEEGLEARLLLQVHDELIAECPESERERVCEILKSEMEQAAELKVPLTVEANSGHSWAEAH